MKIFDCFPFHNEVDLLSCRLEELRDVVHRFVVVECGETHTGAKKPSFFRNNEKRFREISDRIQYVWAPRLTVADPREREHEQRELIRRGLEACGAAPNDIVIQSDVDEILSATAVATLPIVVGDNGAAFAQTSHFFAVDWLYPNQCEMRPVAKRLRDIDSFWAMRKSSGQAPIVPNGGWHFSWLGDTAQHAAKLEAIYEGPEIAGRVLPTVMARENWRYGVHVDGVKMRPIDVDERFPKLIRERRCPKSWFRPR